jgi:ABC-type multidrug transport system ATPase subunit
MPDLRDTAVLTRGLTRRFGEFTAVDTVNLRIERRDVFGFLGPNGSGKTTVIKMLTGLLPATSGDAWVEGFDVGHDPEAVRSVIGYMSQRFSLYNDLSVIENLQFYGRVYRIDRRRLTQRLDAVIGINHLEPYTHQLAGKLSGGWKQRLALSCAMLHEPKILFLDEPTAGIDPVARRELWDLIFQLSGSGITFFVTTHYMDEAERCNRLAYIYSSRIIAEGTPAELKRMPEVNPPGTRRLELHCSEVTRALQRLRQLPTVLSATAFGQVIHALVEAGFNSGEAAAALSSVGVQIFDIREVPASLEDVFVELTYLRREQLQAVHV